MPVICKAQLPYYPPTQSTDNQLFIGVDAFSFGLPFSIVLTSEFNKNTFRFGASPTLPESSQLSLTDVDAEDITVYLAYTRLIGNQNGYLELGGVVLGGNGSPSGNKLIQFPAVGLLGGFYFEIGNKLLFRANLTPLFNFKETQLTAGFGFSYKF